MAYNSQYHQLFKAMEHSPVLSNCCTSSSNLTGIEYMKSIVSNVDLHEKDCGEYTQSRTQSIHFLQGAWESVFILFHILY